MSNNHWISLQERNLRKKAKGLGFEIRRARLFHKHVRRGGKFLHKPEYPPTMAGGGFRLVRLNPYGVALGADGWNASLDDISAFLKEAAI